MNTGLVELSKPEADVSAACRPSTFQPHLFEDLTQFTDLVRMLFRLLQFPSDEARRKLAYQNQANCTGRFRVPDRGSGNPTPLGGWGQHLWARGCWVVNSGNVTD